MKITAKLLAAEEASRIILDDARDLLIDAGLSEHFSCTYDDVADEIILIPTSQHGQQILAYADDDLARMGARDINLDS